MAKRIIQTEAASEDVVIEKGLRPSSLDQYVGQEKAKNNLKIFIEAAKSRNEQKNHKILKKVINKILWDVNKLFS